jgi:hypothetical protein
LSHAIPFQWGVEGIEEKEHEEEDEGGKMKDNRITYCII